MNSHRQKAYIYFLIVAFIWGVAGPIIKYTLKFVNPDLFLFYRFYISSVVALFIMTFNKVNIPKDKKILTLVLLYGLFTSTVSLGLLFLGLDKTTVLDMSLINVISPLTVVLAGVYFLKEHVTHKEKVGIGIALLGTVIVLIEPVLKFNDGFGALSGNILVFLSLLANTTAVIILKKLLRLDVSPSFLAHISFLIGFITILPFIIIKYGLINSFTILTSLPTSAHLGVIYMALFSGTIAYALGNIAQKSIEVGEAALFTYLQPLFSTPLAVIWLNEKITVPFIIGAVVIAVGVYIAEKKGGLAIFISKT